MKRWFSILIYISLFLAVMSFVFIPPILSLYNNKSNSNFLAPFIQSETSEKNIDYKYLEIIARKIYFSRKRHTKGNIDNLPKENFNENFKEYNFICIQCDLTKIDLTEIDLVGANLFEVNLSGVDLSERKLKFANLENSNLMGSNLSNAIMIYSNLKNADLRNANLTDADLTNANVQNLTLNEETIFCRTKWPSGKDSYTEDNSDC